MDTIRAFIAIEMPPMVVDIVQRSQQVLRRGGIRLAWVRPENVHLTLRFLGDIAADAVDRIRDVLEETARETSPFSLCVKGAGAFPGIARPRVLWLGLDGQLQPMAALYRRLSEKLSGLGIAGEKRPFRGHLTIGRVKGRPDIRLLKERMTELEHVESTLFPADSLCLFKSDLTPGGAVYTSLVKVRTAGADPSG
jgi:2'-5' RNA ligase